MTADKLPSFFTPFALKSVNGKLVHSPAQSGPVNLTTGTDQITLHRSDLTARNDKVLNKVMSRLMIA